MNKTLIKDKLKNCKFLNDLSNLQFSDRTNGKLFSDIFKDCCRYVPEAKCWYVYDGKRWKPDKDSIVANQLAKSLADAMGEYAFSEIMPKVEDESKRKEIIKAITTWQNLKTRTYLLKDAQSEYPIQKSEFDKNRDLFNITNGTLNFRTGELLPHNPNDLITKYSDVIWDANASFPRWESFISEICCEDKELISFLQKAMGYSSSGDTSQECALFLYGATTRNGKSTLVDAIVNVLGEYATTVNAETVMQPKTSQSGSAPNEDLARLAGIRFAHIPEPAKNVILNVARVKSITGNDDITARFLYSSSFTFKPQFKLVVNTNYLPQVNDTTLFKGDRIRVIPFEKHFTETERDPGLKMMFKKEEAKSAILLWLVQGYQRMIDEGFESPKAVKQATKQYSQESDKIQLFKEDCLICNKVAKVKFKAIYEVYTEWCKDNGYKPENRKNFKSMLQTIPDLAIIKANDDETRSHTICVSGYTYTRENLS